MPFLAFPGLPPGGIRHERAMEDKASEMFDLLQAWPWEMGIPYPLEANKAFDASSIPEQPDNGHRSDIYLLKKPKPK